MRSLMAFAQRNLPQAPPKRRKVGPDFHLVELTARGRELAAGAPLRISNGRISVLFMPDEFQPGEYEPVKIARYEWDLMLRDHAHIDGSKLCAIVIADDAPEEENESAAAAEENE